MGSANQVPISFAGYNARAIRRGVLVLAADFCTIISQVLLSRVLPILSGCSRHVRLVLCQNGPDDPFCLVRHGDGCHLQYDASRRRLEQEPSTPSAIPLLVFCPRLWPNDGTSAVQRQLSKGFATAVLHPMQCAGGDCTGKNHQNDRHDWSPGDVN